VTNVNARNFYGFTVEGIKGVIILTEKMPGWHVSGSNKVDTTFWMKIRKEKINPQSGYIQVKAKNEFVENYHTRNVIGYVKGRKKPDRFIVFTAHYDHLGMMGKNTYFPGANDNGSGTAMLMDLARHYAQKRNKPDYSIAFMAFSGEEAGLYGSSYYVSDPLFDLRAILLLVNLDMVGSGSEGITVVNGKAYKSLYDQMVKINEKKNYLPEIKDRGEACNSDHCPFYNTGIKSIFIYTRGKEHLEYHNIIDDADDFPFTAYNGLFKLLVDYLQYVD
jgi:Zn-dependent M28 family amino/carboxypeptidase